MFRAELETIRELLLSELGDIFGNNGYIINKGYDNSFKGITDEIPFYFYLDFVGGDEQINFNLDADLGVKDAYTIDSEFKLVARFTNVDIQSALNVMFSCLASVSFVEIKTITTDSEFILADETGEDLKKCEFQLMKIIFEIEKCVFAKKCFTLDCKENSC